ncbi:MAG: hypothetical protein A2Z25_03750 [Planctomycetes bacterium RBG_16_55_9]|nr:MAG: hypothetical protein A2Z25_03750 [Planctomycetes bacterium RBG_16_55_9]
MSREKMVRNVSWIAIGVIIVVLVVVFATIENKAVRSESVSGGPLENIVRSRETWDVAFSSWSGKAAPDFAVDDVDGQTHKLSDYRDKDLLVVFWATWCPACNAEIPHLIELRKTYAEDKLAILSISNESPEVLKDFAAERGLNYTVASLGRTVLPAPFSSVTSIPTTFFIGRDGTIKLAALGVVPLEQAKAIIEIQAGHG